MWYSEYFIWLFKFPILELSQSLNGWFSGFSRLAMELSEMGSVSSEMAQAQIYPFSRLNSSIPMPSLST